MRPPHHIEDVRRVWVETYIASFGVWKQLSTLPTNTIFCSAEIYFCKAFAKSAGDREPWLHACSTSSWPLKAHSKHIPEAIISSRKVIETKHKSWFPLHLHKSLFQIFVNQFQESDWAALNTVRNSSAEQGDSASYLCGGPLHGEAWKSQTGFFWDWLNEEGDGPLCHAEPSNGQVGLGVGVVLGCCGTRAAAIHIYILWKCIQSTQLWSQCIPCKKDITLYTSALLTCFWDMCCGG